MKNTEKWPTFFRVTQVVDSPLSALLNLYLIVGVVNGKQADEAGGDIDRHARIQIEADRYVVASLVDEHKLREILHAYRGRAKHWRGQYQSMSVALVAACEEALSASSPASTCPSLAK